MRGPKSATMKSEYRSEAKTEKVKEDQSNFHDTDEFLEVGMFNDEPIKGPISYASRGQSMPN